MLTNKTTGRQDTELRVQVQRTGNLRIILGVITFFDVIFSSITSFFYSHKYLQTYKDKNDTIGRMELHSNPVAIRHKQLKENI